MFDFLEKLWSGNPNVPQIPYDLYLVGKIYFAGNVVSTMVYGIFIAQFFKCISALLNRTGRDIKWGLVIHTVLMFLCVTINIAGGLYMQSISYIDDRELPGGDTLYPGPIGCQSLIGTDALNSTYDIMFYLNQWLADGLLLYRCCVIFSMNYLSVALPCLLYLTSVATGHVTIYKTLRPNPLSFSIGTHPAQKKHSKCHGNDAQNLADLYIALWGTQNPVQMFFFPLLILSQVIGPFLITQRVANRTALMSDTISGNVDSIRFGSRGESTVYDGTLTDEMSTMDADGETPGGRGIGVECVNTVDGATAQDNGRA